MSNASFKPHILGILGSTRKGRFGETVATWFHELAAQRDDCVYEPVDLRDWPLPFFDEEEAPTSGNIAPEAETWAKKIGEADGFVFILPEYNRGYPAVLKNAIDHLWYEWNNKPLGLVGYGGAAGGGRALQQIRVVAMELELVPIRSEVTIVSVRRQFDDDGNLTATHYNKTANQMLDQVIAYARALPDLREELAY